MAKKETLEFQAKLTDDNGIIRGRIPAPLVQHLGGSADDFIVFRREDSGKFTLSLKRTATTATSGTKKTASSSKKRK